MSLNRFSRWTWVGQNHAHQHPFLNQAVVAKNYKRHSFPCVRDGFDDRSVQFLYFSTLLTRDQFMDIKWPQYPILGVLKSNILKPDVSNTNFEKKLDESETILYSSAGIPILQKNWRGEHFIFYILLFRCWFLARIYVVLVSWTLGQKVYEWWITSTPGRDNGLDSPSLQYHTWHYYNILYTCMFSPLILKFLSSWHSFLGTLGAFGWRYSLGSRLNHSRYFSDFGEYQPVAALPV